MKKKKRGKFAQSNVPASMKKRTVLTLILFSVVIVAVLGAAMIVRSMNETDLTEVARVNGEPIVARELETQMKRLKADVQNYYKVQYKASINNHFWDDDFNGENPMETLRKRALDEAVRRKIELKLAQEHNLIDFSSYQDLLKHLDLENERRKTAIAKGEVVYGLSTYSESEYYNHLMSNLRLNLKDLMSKTDKDPLFVTENEARSNFMDNRDRWLSKDNSYTVLKISIPYRTQDHREEAYSQVQKALADLDKGLSFNEAAKKYNEGGKIQTQTFNQESYQSDERSSFNMRSAAESLQINEYSKEILDDNASYNIVMLTSKDNEEMEAYEVNKNNIKSMVVDEKYEAYINEQCQKAQIEINEKDYNQAMF